MATRKFVTADGQFFDKAADARAHEERAPHIAFMEGLGLPTGDADVILSHFETTFRVPKKRAPKQPKVVAPTNKKAA